MRQSLHEQQAHKACANYSHPVSGHYATPFDPIHDA